MALPTPLTEPIIKTLQAKQRRKEERVLKVERKSVLDEKGNIDKDTLDKHIEDIRRFSEEASKVEVIAEKNELYDREDAKFFIDAKDGRLKVWRPDVGEEETITMNAYSGRVAFDGSPIFLTDLSWKTSKVSNYVYRVEHRLGTKDYAVTVAPIGNTGLYINPSPLPDEVAFEVVAGGPVDFFFILHLNKKYRRVRRR